MRRSVRTEAVNKRAVRGQGGPSTVAGTQRNVTYRFGTGTSTGTPLAEARSPSTLGLAGLRVEHYIIDGFGMWREEPAPLPVLRHRARRPTPSLKAGDPRGFLTAWHPQLFGAVALAEHHQHTHQWGIVRP
jgi:hypothetical protein